MRWFLSLLLLFAGAIGLAVAARYNAGNVVLFYPPYRVDVSLNFFLLGLLLLFVSLYFTLYALARLQRLPGKVIAYRRGKREREGNQALRDGIKASFEGRYGQAEKAAARALLVPANAGLAALIAATAAHRLRQPERRDTWLATIADDDPLKTARAMTRLELLVDAHQPKAALQTFDELNANGIRHIHALRLALKANQQRGNWSEVVRLVHLLNKHDALHPTLSERLQELAYQNLFSDPLIDTDGVKHLWTSVPSAQRLNPVIAVSAAQAFRQRELPHDACGLLEKALNSNWDERLIRAYRGCAADDASPLLRVQIERCEHWLALHPSDSELELTLGLLCLRQKLWGKAQRHLEQALSDSIDIYTKREAHLRLAELFEALAQSDNAAMHYRESALLSCT